MTGTAGWSLYSDPRFPLCCRYPAVTPEGHAVIVRETASAHLLRAHIVSPDSQEVYLEISRYPELTAGDVYRLHRRELEHRFGELVITSLAPVVLAARPAQRYIFSWQHGRRAAYLVEIGRDACRILHNPASPLNNLILATLEWSDS